MLLLFGALLGAALQIQAQGHSVPDAVLEDHRRVVPGEIVVKFIDDADCDVVYDNMGKALSAFDVQVFLPEGVVVAESKVLFDKKSIDRSLDHKAELAAKSTKTPQEMSMKGISLKNVFQVKLELSEEGAGPDPTRDALAALNENPLVEYAEPNYVVKLEDFNVDRILTESDVMAMAAAAPMPPTGEPNDPLYVNQANLGQVHLPEVWANHTSGDSTQVIAILDSGVDYNHPDLAANTWVNHAEVNGIEGYDDDGNGYVDDFHGWDFINADNAPLDDNLHGTHVAGIAAAVTDNEIGIAGACWNAQIMPIKVFQSTGVGNASTIAEGISYAANNGATVLNMSFGSNAESSLMLSALENAYATAALVASAGNNGIKIGPCIGCYPHYPSAYSFVLGVEDSPKPTDGYTNWDQDGPVFTQYANLLNYEVTTPGTGILSTVPNGGYASVTGTSMSAPLMSACVALYQELKPEDSKELMFGSFINTSDGDYVNLLACIETDPIPQLQVLSATFRDTIAGQNGNGYTESGEIIEILPLIKNYWGPSDDVRVGIAFAQYEDTSKADILVSEAALGSVSAYATLQNLDGGLQIQLDENVNNNVDIRFDVSVWSGPDSAYLSTEEIVVNVKNRILLSGLISEDYVMEEGKEYLIVDNVAMGTGTLLTIEPGVRVYFSDNKSMICNGSLVAMGTPENRIVFQPENVHWEYVQVGGDSALFHNCNFVLGADIRIGDADYHEFEDCQWYDFNGIAFGNARIKTSNITERIGSGFSSYYWTATQIDFRGNNLINNREQRLVGTPSYISNQQYQNFSENNVFNNWLNVPGVGVSTAWKIDGAAIQMQDSTNYFGSASEQILASSIIDFFEDSGLPIAEVNAASQPSALAHGIVWKVLVNGVDAQDEYEALDPIGVGEHEFQIYFNRAMDVSVAPKLSYGVTIPYNQRQVSEEGTWSADSTVYTVTHEVGIGAADGISRIRVQDAVDNEGWTIPVEDSRFNMFVQSAGSASTGFFATPGLGKIELNWEAPSEELVGDLLGYNMYRHQVDTAGNELEVQLLNTALLTDETFVDFDVDEGEQYFYKYKILRTSFQETDFSSSVTASPLTALLGDSNGDFAVNVMDVIHDVDYILGMNPQPFIFNAADVNNDLMINVLDVVGTVDIILNPVAGGMTVNAMAGPNYYPNTPVGEVTLTWENGTLVAQSQHAIAGLQLALEGTHEVTFPAALAGMEKMVYQQEGQTIVLLFNFANQGFDAGRTELFSIADGEAELDLTRASVANDGGAPLTPVFRSEVLRPHTSPAQNDGKDWLVSFPNPASDAVQLEYCLPRTVEQVDLVVYNAQGAVVARQSNLRNAPGISAHTLDVSSWQSGNYVVVLRGLQGRHVVCHQVERLAVR
ncbi:MAG: S8 family serine peptidase [Flavobacteriales bacterium]